MTFSIGRALVVGDGGKELRELLAMPWGVVSLVDLYTGFTIFSLWIWLRAESKLAAIGWTAGMMVGGFWTGRYVPYIIIIIIIVIIIISIISMGN